VKLARSLLFSSFGLWGIDDLANWRLQRWHVGSWHQQEPVIVHLGKKFTLDRIAGPRADYGINPALGAKGSLAVMNPIFNFARRKDLKTMKASAKVALHERQAVIARPVVRRNVVFG